MINIVSEPDVPIGFLKFEGSVCGCFERHLAVIPEKVCSTYKGFVCVSVCECVTPVVCRDHVNTGLVRLRCGGGG